METRGPGVKKCLIVSALLLALALCGCSQRIREGEVAAKHFYPAHTEIKLIPIVGSNGKSTSTTLMPFVFHYPDKWTVTIQQYSEKKGKMLSATYRVTKAVYDEIEIGAEFAYDPDMEPAEPEYRTGVYQGEYAAFKKGGVTMAVTRFEDAPDVLRVKEAADLLRVKEDVMYRMVHRADFPSFMVGKCIRISRVALEEWVDKQTRGMIT